MEDRDRRRDLTRLVREEVFPTWHFDDATFDRTAAAFDNPDYAAIVIHNYRWRLGVADGERRYDDLERKLAARPFITVPTLTLDAERDPFTAPGDGGGYRDRFTGAYEYRTLAGVGHNVPQEAPEAFARGPGRGPSGGFVTGLKGDAGPECAGADAVRGGGCGGFTGEGASPFRGGVPSPGPVPRPRGRAGAGGPRPRGRRSR